MCKYDDEGTLGNSATGTCTWAVRGGNAVPGSKKADLSFGSTGSGFVNLVLHSRISPQNSRISEALLMSFQLHDLGCDLSTAYTR